MRALVASCAALWLASSLLACGTTNSSGTSGGTASSGSTGGGGTTGGSTGGGSTGGSSTGGGTETLTVLNYKAWCSVTINGGAASSSATITASVAPGTVTLTQAPLSGFQLGDWYGVTGDTGSGTLGTVSGGVSTATVTVGSSAVCVSVCCPFTGGSGCPGSNQCP